jgi:hypothetical protein
MMLLLPNWKDLEDILSGNGDSGCHKILQGPVHRCDALTTVFCKVRDVGGGSIIPCDTRQAR